MDESLAAVESGSPSDAVVSGILRSLQSTRNNVWRRRFFSTLAIVFCLLALTVAWSSLNWSRAIQATERSRIDSELQADELRPSTAVDLSRRALLESLSERAEGLDYEIARLEAQKRLAKIAPAKAQKGIVHPSKDRRELIGDQLGKYVLIESPSSIEVVDIESQELILKHLFPNSAEVIWCLRPWS